MSLFYFIYLRKVCEFHDFNFHRFIVVSGCSVETGNDTPCENFKRSVIRKIKGVAETDEIHPLIVTNINQPEDSQTIPEEEEIMSCSQHELLDYMDTIGSTFNDWIVNIEKEAKLIVQQCDDGDRDNLMYNPTFAVQFRKMCKLLLLWSALGCSIFESPYETSSSSNVECDFKNVKLSMNDVIPCRVDVFVQKHLEMLDGAVKTASRKYITLLADDRCSENEGAESDFELDRLDERDIKEQFVDSHEDVQDEVFPKNSETACVACTNNDVATGAHKCFICGKNVHVLPGCSSSIGLEEGYGEKRICTACSNDGSSYGTEKYSNQKSSAPAKPLRKSVRQKIHANLNPSTETRRRQASTTVSTKPGKPFVRKNPIVKNSNEPEKTGDDDIITRELNHQEKWSKRKNVKRSIYTKPSPYWDLTTNINKKVKLGFLINGTCDKIIRYVNKVPVSVGNTCCFDSIAQVAN